MNFRFTGPRISHSARGDYSGSRAGRGHNISYLSGNQWAWPTNEALSLSISCQLLAPALIMAAWRRNNAAMSSSSDPTPPKSLKPCLSLMKLTTLPQSSVVKPPVIARDHVLMAMSLRGRSGCASPWVRLDRRITCKESRSKPDNESGRRHARPNDAAVSSLRYAGKWECSKCCEDEHESTRAGDVCAGKQFQSSIKRL